MNWVVINFNQFIQILLPTFLRKPKLLAFLNSIVKPLDSLYKETLNKMQHTCQVIYLEKMLNEYFEVPNYNPIYHDSTKIIYIEDAPIPPTKYIYLDQEIPPNNYLYLGTHYLTGDIDHIDFIVYIPSNYVFEEDKLRAIINYYKLAGKKYTIELF